MTKYLILVFFLIYVVGFSQNIEGNYYALESKCDIKLNIKSKNLFIFIVNKKKKQSGTFKIYKEDKITYFDFDDISSVYKKDTISIQNSGNSINEYWHFKECDEKYIHLVKKKIEKKYKIENCNDQVKME